MCRIVAPALGSSREIQVQLYFEISFQSFSFHLISNRAESISSSKAALEKKKEK